MQATFYRKIVRDRKDRYQFSMNIPGDFVKKLQLEGAMTEVGLENNSITIRKISGPSSSATTTATTTDSIRTSLPENEKRIKPYDLGDKRYY